MSLSSDGKPVMQLSNSFSVRAPIDAVWAALLDFERAARCLPGARVLAPPGGDGFALALDLAWGESSVSYRGQVAVVEQEVDDRRAVFSVDAADADGDGTAQGRIELTLLAAGDLTEATLESDLALSGDAATIEESAVCGVSERLTDEFARSLAAMLGGAAPTVNGGGPAPAMAPRSDPAAELPAELRVLRVEAAGRGAGVEVEEAQARPAQAEDGRGRSRPSSGGGSWAEASRQAGVAIERLRSPIGAMLLGLVLVHTLVRRSRRRSLRGASRAASAPAGSA